MSSLDSRAQANNCIIDMIAFGGNVFTLRDLIACCCVHAREKGEVGEEEGIAFYGFDVSRAFFAFLKKGMYGAR